MVARIAFENGFDTFCLKGSDNALRAVATPRKRRLGVRASFDPSEKYAHRSGRSNSPASTYSAKLGTTSSPTRSRLHQTGRFETAPTWRTAPQANSRRYSDGRDASSCASVFCTISESASSWRFACPANGASSAKIPGHSHGVSMSFHWGHESRPAQTQDSLIPRTASTRHRFRLGFRACTQTARAIRQRWARRSRRQNPRRSHRQRRNRYALARYVQRRFIPRMIAHSRFNLTSAP